ncbi:hypothetical protein T484DRAFT_1791002 [Baffinella frigidus]|nr:hypothetical protein T484DRAFT_1791002 [Cryptophyta sp. CCMP2293]
MRLNVLQMAFGNLASALHEIEHEMSAFGNLASALHEMGRDREAVDVARRGVQIDPNYAHGYNILGTLLRPSKGAGGQPGEARAAYETAVRLAPTFVDAILNLAGLLVEDEAFDHSLGVVGDTTKSVR